jgi:hypothetical protein
MVAAKGTVEDVGRLDTGVCLVFPFVCPQDRAPQPLRSPRTEDGAIGSVFHRGAA